MSSYKYENCVKTLYVFTLKLFVNNLTDEILILELMVWEWDERIEVK